jgi:uncharacterized NAD(P)/FAD-binding protein YdhS
MGRCKDDGLMTIDGTTPQARTIAIVGAGFCGTVLATRLLRAPPARPARILLLERSGVFGRGVAYARRDHDYLLNVPAGRMSATPFIPDEFLEYARQREPSVGAEDFLPRAWYGDYLQERLAAAERDAPRGLQFERVEADVQAVHRWRRDAPLRIECANGSTIVADDVVLAVGNAQPGRLAPVRRVEGHPAYVADPWGVPAGFRRDERVLCIGTGLTMVDIATAAFARDPSPAVVYAVSRHGLVPPRQTAFRADALRTDGDAALLAAAPSASRLLRVVRELGIDAERAGGDWREAITHVRRMAPVLWQRMPASERSRFLRHARAYWDVHRHRLPAETLARIDELRTTGQLEIVAARLDTLEPEGERLRVTLRARGGHAQRQIVVDRVLNCTGPDYDLRRLEDPLWRQLRSDGLAVPDELGLGLRTGPDGAVVDRDGWPGPHLWYLGPMLRAAHWEATGAVELRDRAELLAVRLASRDSQ